jgi:hypothetical protein
MFKGHMSILYVGCRKFSTNWFVGNLCPLKNTKDIKIIFFIKY